MTNTKENTVQPVYDLIAILEDAKRGYLSAAERIKDDVLSLLFERFGYQRGRYSNELKQLVNHLQADSVIDNFTLSLLHRTWMDLKTTFKFGKRDTIILACIKGEETAIKNYTEAIEELHHNYEVKAILQRQLNGIKTVLNTIKEYTGKAGR
jgi:uncharacterized protein (TIGR02284 family)